MQNAIVEIPKNSFPKLLNEIPDPPERLFMRGIFPDENKKFLCVVGARHCSTYGIQVCSSIIRSLAGYNIVIVSGLAIGIDSLAHRTALEVGLPTVAVPGSGLNWDVIHPKANVGLAEEIVVQGGALLTEFLPDHKARAYDFPLRNRIMAGISHAILVIEASLSSGTLITAKLALDYNRDVLAVPGSIFSKQSEGSHMLLSKGACLVRSYKDVLQILGFETDNDLLREKSYSNCSQTEKHVLSLLDSPCNKDELIARCGSDIRDIAVAISLLEMKGYIGIMNGEIRRL